MHQVRVTPPGTIAVVPACAHHETGAIAGSVGLFAYRGGKLAPLARIEADPARAAPWRGIRYGAHGFAARHVDFHPTRPWMYLCVEAQGEIHLYDYDADRVALAPRFIKSTLDGAPRGRSAQLASAIHVHPNGRYVYVSNRARQTETHNGRQVFAGGVNDIAVFEIDQATGEPSLIQHVDTLGIFPRTFGIDASGTVLVVGNQEPLDIRVGDEIQRVVPSLVVFRIGEDGRLTRLHKHDHPDNGAVCFWVGVETHRSARMSKLRKVLAAVVILAVIVVAGAAAFMSYWPSFGGAVTGPRLDQVRASPQHKGDVFENVVPQSPRSAGLIWQYLRQQFEGTEVRVPPQPIPVVRLGAERFKQPPAAGLTAIWFGHASVYLELDGIRLMVDPILSDWASPVAGIGPKRFHPPPADLQDLPKIDAVLISHDHYDHLDMETVKRLQATGSHFFVPLGIGAHLERWDVPKSQFTELDWWQSVEVRGVRLTSTPVRHYSGRGLRDGNATLWSSWAMVGPTQRVFFSGDTGFGDHFQTIGERLGPFDLGIVKIGAYGPGQSWLDIHMEPEAAVDAHLKLRARRMLPVHWATFNLAFHAWDEPIRRTVEAARRHGVELVTPRIGEAVTSQTPFVSTAWWEAIR